MVLLYFPSDYYVTIDSFDSCLIFIYNKPSVISAYMLLRVRLDFGNLFPYHALCQKAPFLKVKKFAYHPFFAKSRYFSAKKHVPKWALSLDVIILFLNSVSPHKDSTYQCPFCYIRSLPKSCWFRPLR